MAGCGPPPKPAHLRQRTNRKSSAMELPSGSPGFAEVPEIPRPDATAEPWHPLTVSWWTHVWTSPMASQYLPTDVDGLGRVAMLVDKFYKTGNALLMAEIRLQEARFGLSPLDRSRLQWEIAKADEAVRKRPPVDTKRRDPRQVLRAVK